eukprot:GILJ01006327.1.p1 GENE.GILJ01006327.1~~GILJ01006327.1.p1  ORF type:complete len:403 (-),score=67.11 GILJ01006327.1:187-1395(-)
MFRAAFRSWKGGIQSAQRVKTFSTSVPLTKTGSKFAVVVGSAAAVTAAAYLYHDTTTASLDAKQPGQRPVSLSEAPKKVVRVVVSGAAGQIGYALTPLICSGQVFGPNTKVILHLLDVSFMESSLKGLMMEIEDGAFPLVEKVVATSDLATAFQDVDVAILVGGFPRKAGMERKDLISKNVSIFREQGQALDAHAKKDVKVLVVANPANTNALIASTYAPSIPKENFSCLTRLDHNRALSQVAIKANVPVSDVKNVVIWGNHSSTQYPDVNHGVIRGQPIRQAINDDAYLNGPFISTVQKRGAAIIEARKLGSAMSAANAIKDHMKDWLQGTGPGEFVSMGVLSNGSYGIEEGLCFSYPVQCGQGKCQIVQGLTLDEFSRKMIAATKKELLEEKEEALNVFK